MDTERGRIAVGWLIVEDLAMVLALPGIGPWTVAYIRMRALSDPDAFPATDVGVLRALAALGAGAGVAVAERWRPWRSYAVHHLWATLEPAARETRPQGAPTS